MCGISKLQNKKRHICRFLTMHFMESRGIDLLTSPLPAMRSPALVSFTAPILNTTSYPSVFHDRRVELLRLIEPSKNKKGFLQS